MPEPCDIARDRYVGVDTLLLQRSSNQDWASRCFCGSGVKSEFYNTCFACRFDVKPEEKAPNLLDQSFWSGAPELILAAPPAPTVTEDIVASPFGQASIRVTRPRTPPSDESASARSIHARSPRRAPSSAYRTFSQRGRPPNGSRPGPPGFKGVRQRKGVRGYLVEIRPPKWKRTIWLGTYNTDREAAGAYDAGVFYTNKKTKYNFPALKDTFPSLPAQLRLDNPEDAEEIKTFVQREARDAAKKVKSLPPAETSATSTVTTHNGPSAGATSATSAASSEESSDNVAEYNVAGNIVIPGNIDEEWFATMFDDLMCNVGFQQGASLQQATSWPMGSF